MDILKDKVEPTCVGGQVNKRETRVSKRIKVFSQQAQKGVSELPNYINMGTK